MRIRFEYLPPLKGEPLWIKENPEWKATAAVVYHSKSKTFEPELPSACFQMFWPVNPWEQMERLENELAA